MNIPHRRQDVVTRWEQPEMEEYASMEEERFRELIRLRTMRSKVLTAADEAELLNDAVRRLGVPLNRARSIMLAEADTKSIELESDLGDTAVAMMKSMASPKGKLSRTNFELIVQFYKSRMRGTDEQAKTRIKQLMLENAIEPKPNGLLRSLRWYRNIK